VLAAVEAAKALLDTGTTLFAGAQGAGIDMALLRDLHLMTAKPFLYVFNLDEEELANEAFKDELRGLVAPAEAIFLDAKVEADLVELDDAEKLELLRSIGQDESGLDLLAHVGFRTLGLQTYLTAGPKEARAWTIRRGATAPEAAGVIHTDFQRGLHQGGGRVVRRPGRRRLDGRGEVARQGPHRGQGLRHGRRRRRGVPLQRLALRLRKTSHGTPPDVRAVEVRLRHRSWPVVDRLGGLQQVLEDRPVPRQGVAALPGFRCQLLRRRDRRMVLALRTEARPDRPAVRHLASRRSTRTLARPTRPSWRVRLCR
jgi:hypothetical protein